MLCSGSRRQFSWGGAYQSTVHAYKQAVAGGACIIYADQEL